MKALLFTTLLLCSHTYATSETDNAYVLLGPGVLSPTFLAQPPSTDQVYVYQSSQESKSVQESYNFSKIESSVVGGQVSQNSTASEGNAFESDDQASAKIFDHLREENNQLKNQLDVLKTDVAKLNDDLAAVYGTNENMSNDLYAAEAIIASLKNQLAALNVSLSASRNETSSLKVENGQIRQQNQNIQAVLNDSNNKLQTANDKITELQNQHDLDESALESSTNDVFTLNMQVSAERAQYMNLKDRNDQVQEDLSNTQESLSDVTTKYAQLQDQHKALVAAKNDVENKFTTFKAQVNTAPQIDNAANQILADQLNGCQAALDESRNSQNTTSAKTQTLQDQNTKLQDANTNLQNLTSKLQSDFAQLNLYLSQSRSDSTKLQADKTALQNDNKKLSKSLNESAVAFSGCQAKTKSLDTQVTAYRLMIENYKKTFAAAKSDLFAKYNVCMQDLNYQYSYLAAKVNDLITYGKASNVTFLAPQLPPQGIKPPSS